MAHGILIYITIANLNLVVSCDYYYRFPALRAPSVTISPTQIPTAGDQHTLTCTASIDEFLMVTPFLEWRLPQNAAGLSTGTQVTTGGTSTNTLTFNHIRTSQGGIYGCRATINVAGFDPLSHTANQTIQVQSKLIHLFLHPLLHNCVFLIYSSPSISFCPQPSNSSLQWNSIHIIWYGSAE